MKRNENGIAEKYKVRFLIKRFVQIEGVDFAETFALTSRLETFGLVLAIAEQRNLHLELLDVKSFFSLEI